MLGTNGGGFFNANSAHPFENPTPLSNFLQMLSIFLIPAGLTVTLGTMVGSPKHGWAVLAAMTILWFCGVFVCYWAEAQPNPLMHNVDQHASLTQSGGNMEGKEVRFGIANSALFATVTTDASCGAVNSMHDSFTPLGGLVPLTNIMLGEIVFGGVGAGLYGMLVFVVISVFIAGLMVGRTPEYLGKKIEAYDVQMAMLYLLIFPLIILGFAAVAVLMPNLGLSALTNHGPHGLSEILYAYASATGNNGSAFAGLSANTHWYNYSLGFAMFFGRFMMAIPMLAIAGNLAGKEDRPRNRRNLPRHHAALHGPAHLGHRHRRRAHLLPRAVPRPHPGAPAPPRRPHLLGIRRNHVHRKSSQRPPLACLIPRSFVAPPQTLSSNSPRRP